MKARLSTNELLSLISDAERAYEGKGSRSISQRLRISAMKNFVSQIRRENPQELIEISLEDHLLLTDLPK